MMKKIPLLLLLLLPACCAAAASAATPPLELSWKDCARAALDNNPGLKAKKLAVEQNKYLYQSQAGINYYLSSVGISHSLSRSGSDTSSPATSASTRLSASEPLLDLKGLSSVRSAKLRYDASDAAYKIESANLRQSLYSAFVNLVYAQENLATQKKILVIRQNSSQLVKLDYDSGTESPGNMMTAAAKTQVSSSSVIQAGRSLDSARRDLLNAMGFSDFRPIVAKASLTAPDYTFDTGSIKKLIETIPQVVSQKNSLESVREQLLSARYDLYPTLTASQSLGWSGDKELPGMRSWSLGLSLNLPIFSNGITYYANNTRAAELALKGGEASLRDTENNLEGSIRNGYSDFLNARDNALVNVGVLDAAEETYKESQIKYQAGQMSFIDLETTEQSLVDAQLRQLSLFQTANTRKISMESLIGIGLEVE